MGISVQRVKHGVPGAARGLLRVLAMVLLFLLFSFHASAADNAVGEKMVFQVGWSFVPAGEVVLEEVGALPEGALRRHFLLTASTYPFLDIFYKVRDTVESLTDTTITQSFGYSKKQQGRTKRDIELTFDWEKGQVQYRNFEEILAPVAVEPGTLDPLSAFFHLRHLEFETGKKITRMVTDGKKVVFGEVNVRGKERVTTPFGSFDAWVLEPLTRDLGGVFEKSPDARLMLWISDDERRILLRARSRVLIGSIEVELVGYTPRSVPDGS